jgi:putative hydrolase of the HAD superfamily
MLAVIKNIVFDFGGVILNIDHHRVENAFERLGIRDFEQLFNQASQSELFKALEKGEKTSAEFRDEIRKLIGLNLTDATIDHTWNEIICDYPPERILLLKEIRNHHRLFLLSNTNVIHYNYYIPKFRNEFGFDFESLFENVYWSFKIGMRKPDPDPFLLLLKNETILPEETLFIDDTRQNTEIARTLGFKTLSLKKGTDITQLFKNGVFTALDLIV